MESGEDIIGIKRSLMGEYEFGLLLMIRVTVSQCTC